VSSAIDIVDVSKTFRSERNGEDKVALNGVSLAVARGETFGFIGENGAGKSTLIKILVGAFRPTTGGAFLFGKSAGDPKGRIGLGFVPENPSLQDYLTPFEVLLMGLRLHGVRVVDERAHCVQWLERFSLAEVAEKSIRTFSKGMTQRVALAHALAINPRLLILDEPLSGLDPVGRRDVVEILADYRNGGGTLFFSSHVLYDVERLADRFGLIHQGRLVAVRSPSELAGEQLGRFRVVYRGNTPVAGAVAVRPGWFECEANEEDVASMLHAICSAGGCLHEVRPLVSLETIFFRHVRNESQTSEKK